MPLSSKLLKLLGKLKWQTKQALIRTQRLIQRLREPKPESLGWLDFYAIQREEFLYQTVALPNNVNIFRGDNPSIRDSWSKWEALQLPQDFSDKTMMDIGCAEGFFVIQSVLAGASLGIGYDLLPNRLRIARAVARAWGIQDRTEFYLKPLEDIPADKQVDITTCLSVLHHLHRGSHDTWRIVANPEKFSKEFQNMLNAVGKVAILTKQQSYFEYAYEYEGTKPAQVDFEKLGKAWEDAGFYRKVEFIGLSMETASKDRAIYHAFK